MALKIVVGKTLPIGVDLASSAVKLAQLRASEGGVELVAAGETAVPRACRDQASRLEYFCHGVRKALRSCPFKGRQAILSLPAHETFVQHVKIPKLPPQERPQALESELEGKLPYPVEDAVIRSTVVGDVYGEDDARQEAIVVAVSRRTLNSYLSMAHHAKLDVVGVNIKPFAIVECFARLFLREQDASRAVLYLDMGAASTQVVLAHGRDPVFARNLAIGGDQLDQAVADKLNISLENAQAVRRELIAGNSQSPDAEQVYMILDETLGSMAVEMTKCLRYYESVFRNRTIDRAVFVGGQAADKRLCQILAQRLALCAQVGDPLARVKFAADARPQLDRRVPQPRWAVAVGLSLGAQRAA